MYIRRSERSLASHGDCRDDYLCLDTEDLITRNGHTSRHCSVNRMTPIQTHVISCTVRENIKARSWVYAAPSTVVGISTTHCQRVQRQTLFQLSRLNVWRFGHICDLPHLLKREMHGISTVDITFDRYLSNEQSPTINKSEKLSLSIPRELRVHINP